jgi:cytochrome c oxidase subunit IV
MSEHAAAHETHHGHVDDADHGGVGKYLLVFLALCVLTSASFFTYSHYWPFGKHAAWAFMMAVSCTKAMLVVMFFMHLLWEANWKWVLTIPASCMSIFLLLMLIPDVGMRQNNGYSRYSFERRIYAAEPQDADTDENKSHDASPAPAKPANSSDTRAL